jgi:soluble lytic murein transglycosylase
MNLKMRLPIGLVASAAVLQFLAFTAHASQTPLPPQHPSKMAQASSSPDGASPTTLEGFVPPSPPVGDLDHLPNIFKAYRSGDSTEALILKSKLTQPAAHALAEWFAIRSGASMSFGRLDAFQREYADWPVSTQIRRRTEDALLAERKPPAEIRAFFAKQPPVSTGGRIALAFALKSDGQDKEADDLIKRIWREETFSSNLEGRIRDRFPGVLTQADHRFRMERLLLKESWGNAMRAADYAGKDYALLAKARMGVFQGKKKADKAFAAVPASLRGDPSYLFSRALFLRRSNKLAEAADIIMQAPRDAELRVDGDEWWAEQRLITRALLDKDNPQLAYKVASHHAAESPAQQIEAEFHAGWIALRFLQDHGAAARHFATVAETALTPISRARVAYWQGRAADAGGQQADAKLFFERAADQPTTYYGQLALEKLGRNPPLRAVDPLSEEERKAFDSRIPVQALQLLQQMDEGDFAIGLYTDLAQSMSDARHVDALAALAASHDNPRAVLTVGKIASQRGFPLDQHAYPLAAIPAFEPVGDDVDPAMVYAIARQESAFNPRAVSSAGARGLMQLMPATAKRTAQRFGVAFSLDRLTEDPSYNAKLGSAHLGELMEDWKGSYILAFASYNAGGGNVKKWIDAYGDPRKGLVDTIDWVERIPFYETRNYVQRVMENLNVYRKRLREKPTPAAAPETVDATSITD